MVEKEQVGNPCFDNFPSLSDRFLFTSDWKSLLTRGCFRRLAEPLSESSDSITAALAQARKAGISRPVVAGAVPFDTTQPCSLFIPEQYEFFERHRLTQAATAMPQATREDTDSCREVPDQPEFMRMVSRAVQAMQRGEAEKVVLSRLLDIRCRRTVDITSLMSQIVRQNPDNYHFHVPLSSGGVLLGASPELLIKKQDNHFFSCPLAGSAGRQSDVRQDLLAGEALINSAKDRREHQLVTDAMRETLQGVSETLSVPASPRLLSTGTLWHLATDIQGTIKHSSQSALSLAALLHPTPALSGFPHHQAQALIRRLEPFDRQLFGGMVGWCDDQGNGEWAVTIRCATVHQQNITLFAGAGIIPASDPLSEWQETGVKLTTMLKAFGLVQ